MRRKANRIERGTPLKPPEFIYKYSAVNQYFFEALRRSSFWFSHHDKLNDPLDCKLDLSDELVESHFGPTANIHLFGTSQSMRSYGESAASQLTQLTT